MRICSLLPSATEIVYGLCVSDQLVAATHECDLPQEAARLPDITRSAINHAGSTSREVNSHFQSSSHQGSNIYHQDEEMLRRLTPDLMLTQELYAVSAVSHGEVCRAARVLEAPRRIISLEPSSLSGMLDTIAMVGEVAGVRAKAGKVTQRLKHRIVQVVIKVAADEKSATILAVEWLDSPLIGRHWVPEMLRLAGGQDALGKEGESSAIVPWERTDAYDQDVIVLMPCGFDRKRTVLEESKTTFPTEWPSLKTFQQRQVYAVDGSAYFARLRPE